MSVSQRLRPTDQNGKQLFANIRQDEDGTWSRNVWSGYHNATTLRRYYGYRSRGEARDGSIMELPEGGRIGKYE